MADENPGKPMLGNYLIKSARQSSLKWSTVPPNNLGRISQYIGERAREIEREKERNKSKNSVTKDFCLLYVTNE